jgi:hypothetical protein
MCDFGTQKFRGGVGICSHFKLNSLPGGGDAGKSIYTDFLTFQIIPHLDQSVY